MKYLTPINFFKCAMLNMSTSDNNKLIYFQNKRTKFMHIEN